MDSIESVAKGWDLQGKVLAVRPYLDFNILTMVESGVQLSAPRHSTEEKAYLCEC